MASCGVYKASQQRRGRQRRAKLRVGSGLFQVVGRASSTATKRGSGPPSGHGFLVSIDTPVRGDGERGRDTG
ncbi:hypothetical protein VTJ04DRAFT_6050 [Mycothermus thermophilus]|uniref:uncharacterized protein n=1 Tax=Humicola insolens TaxID=85995 RepID=UPI0037422B36